MEKETTYTCKRRIYPTKPQEEYLYAQLRFIAEATHEWFFREYQARRTFLNACNGQGHNTARDRETFALVQAAGGKIDWSRYNEAYSPWLLDGKPNAYLVISRLPSMKGVYAKYLQSALRSCEAKLRSRCKAAKTIGEPSNMLKFLGSNAERYSLGHYAYSFKTPEGEIVEVPAKPRRARSLSNLELINQAQVAPMATRDTGVTRRVALGRSREKFTSPRDGVVRNLMEFRCESRPFAPQASGVFRIARDGNGLGQWYVLYSTAQRRSNPIDPSLAAPLRVGIDLGSSQDRRDEDGNLCTKANEWISASEPVLTATQLVKVPHEKIVGKEVNRTVTITDQMHIMTPSWILGLDTKIDRLVSKRDLTRNERDSMPFGSDERAAKHKEVQKIAWTIRRIQARRSASVEHTARTAARRLAERVNGVVFEALDHEEMRSESKIGRRTKRAMGAHQFGRVREIFKQVFTEVHGPEAFVEVDPAYTSRTCSVCFTVNEASARNKGVLKCAGCGAVHHDDTNAAKMILASFTLAGRPELAKFEAKQRQRQATPKTREVGATKKTKKTRVRSESGLSQSGSQEVGAAA